MDMLMLEDTRELAARARAGDRKAFERLFGIFRERLERAVTARLGAELRAAMQTEDILQETALRALRSIGHFEWREEDSFLRWLLGIAEHILRDQADKQRLRRAGPLPPDQQATTASPSAASRREERLVRLEKALGVLPEEQREVILLARIDGLPVAEIARRLGLTPNAVSQRLWRALRKLRDEFGDTESYHLPPRGLPRTKGREDRHE